MGESVLLRSFAAGELDPGISLRADLAAYQQGLRTCRNFFVRRSGGVQSRAGLEHIATCKLEDRTFLYPFIFPFAGENYLIEAGNLYFRFHHKVRGLVLELVTPYTRDHLEASNPVYWHQSGLAITLTHHLHPPRELRYTGPDTFTLVEVTIAPGIAPPEGLGVSESAGTEGTAHQHNYQVTAVSATYEESVPTPVVGVSSVPGTPETPLNIEWLEVPGAVEYKVYRDDGDNNTFGYIGTATGQLIFHDIGVPPDLAFTPPQQPALFDATNTYPVVNAKHNQRQIFAGTDLRRDELFASRVGHSANFTHRSPFQDDDAIRWINISKDAQIILHLVSLGPLVVLTDRGEWIVHGDQDGALTPTTIYPEQRGYVGSGWAPPVVYGERLLFVQARQATVREWVPTVQAEGLSGRDLTRNAAHLFRGGRLVSMAFSLLPDPILWCVRDNGILLGMTYVPDEDVLAWHRHDTDGGNIEWVVTLPEDTEDAVYCIVERDGARTIERLGLRDDPEATAARLDRRVRLTRVPTRAVAGLTHLAQREVTVVADGTVVPGRHRVTATGELTLPQPAAVVDVGQPITAILETLDLDTAGSDVRDRRKKITALSVLVEHSLANFEVGPDLAHLRPVTLPQWDGDAATRFTGRIELAPVSNFNDDGRMVLRHTAPTTLTVLGLLPVVDVGG